MFYTSSINKDIATVTLFSYLLRKFIYSTLTKNIKKNKAAKAYKFDVAASMIVLILYIISNVWFIWQASEGN